MGLNEGIQIEGIDMNIELVKICQQRGYKVQQSDCLSLPYDDSTFDYCLNIAVLHHISTVERRLKAIQESLQCFIHQQQFHCC